MTQMKSIPLMFVAALLTTGAWALDFQVERDHRDCFYKCGETAVFTVTAYATNGVRATSGKVEWTLDNYAMCGALKTGSVDLARTNPFTVRGTLDKPGFLRINLKADGFKYPNLVGGWSVGYEPEKIRKAGPMPDDFDAFWAEGKRKLAAKVPLDVRIVPYPEKSTADYNYYRISFATFGRRIYGFLSTPKDETKKYPARLRVASGGWGNWTNFQPGKKNMVFLWFSVYPFEPSWDWKTDGSTAKFHKMCADLRKKWKWGGYDVAGIGGRREDFIFYPVVLGIDRAADWLADHPLVRKGDLTYAGGSQSGGTGFFLLAINHRFRKAMLTVTAHADAMAHLDGRIAGGPRCWELAPTDADRAAVDRNLPYYDAANCASRVTCPVRMTVGFRDPSCIPPCIYATYNELKVADKAIIPAVDSGHGMPDSVLVPILQWLEK